MSGQSRIDQMRNATLSERPPTGTYRTRPGERPENLFAIRAGYRDAAAGLPFRADVDTWPTHLQVCYEHGRLVHANILAAGIQPPEWPLSSLLRPAAYTRAAEAASEMVGTWRPGARALICYEPETLGALRPVPGIGRGVKWRPLPVPTFA